ncbi:MAG: type II secretion system F family protein, partial [Isosphaeraceae bacterium]|nr:type II secretion system F family protein [Isosphaeraceae bacterium]
SYAELRRAIGLALCYPLIVLLLAYGLFLGFVLGVAPRFVEAFRTLHLPIPGVVVSLAGMGETVAYWGPIVPALLVLVGAWWLASGRAAVLQPGWTGGLLGGVPGMRRLLANTRAANFAELLALLVEQQIPFEEAVPLAAEATGEAALRRAAGEIGGRLQRGEPVPASFRGVRGVPPLLAWLVATGQQQGNLPAALHYAAQLYRRRALHQADWVRVVLPTILMFGLGASAVVLYALMVFAPLANLLSELALS